MQFVSPGSPSLPTQLNGSSRGAPSSDCPARHSSTRTQRGRRRPASASPACLSAERRCSAAGQPLVSARWTSCGPIASCCGTGRWRGCSSASSCRPSATGCTSSPSSSSSTARPRTRSSSASSARSGCCRTSSCPSRPGSSRTASTGGYVLLVSDLARAACMVVLAILVASDGPLWAITLVAMLAACFSTFFYPAIGALLPEPRPRRARVRARQQRLGDARQLRLDRRARDRGPAARRRRHRPRLRPQRGLVPAHRRDPVDAAASKATPVEVAPVADDGCATRRRTAGGRFDDLRAAGVKLGAVGGVTLVSSVTLVRVRRRRDPHRRHRDGRVRRRRRGDGLPQRRDRRRRHDRRAARGGARPPAAARAAAPARRAGVRGRDAGARPRQLAAGGVHRDHGPRRSATSSPTSPGTTIFQRAVPDAYRGRFGGADDDGPGDRRDAGHAHRADPRHAVRVRRSRSRSSGRSRSGRRSSRWR